MESFANFVSGSFSGCFWVILDHWGQLKSLEISTKTNRMKLNLCELNFMITPLKSNINCVLAKFCKKKKPFDLNIFLSHMKYGRKIKFK